MPHHGTVERLKRMVMDGLDISTIQDEAKKADLAKEYLATRRFYAKAAIIIVSVICITLLISFIIFGNQVSSQTIDACRSACQSEGSMVDRVSAYTCTCIRREGP